jgi:hypothetical protein
MQDANYHTFLVTLSPRTLIRAVPLGWLLKEDLQILIYWQPVVTRHYSCYYYCCRTSETHEKGANCLFETSGINYYSVRRRRIPKERINLTRHKSLRDFFYNFALRHILSFNISNAVKYVSKRPGFELRFVRCQNNLTLSTFGKNRIFLSSALLGSPLVSNHCSNMAVLEWGCWCMALVLSSEGKFRLSAYRPDRTSV